MPVLSILMRSDNAGKTMREALESLAEQTYKNFEIIAVEDGSQDETGEILEAWARKDRRLHIIKQSHLGIVAALNRGLKECQADPIARMDADDVSLPDRFTQRWNGCCIIPKYQWLAAWWQDIPKSRQVKVSKFTWIG